MSLLAPDYIFSDYIWIKTQISTSVALKWLLLMVLLWYYYGITIVLLWYYYGITIVLLWYYYGTTMVLLWYYYGITMVLL